MTATLGWSGNHVIARAVANHVPPWSLNFYRWVIVAFIMAVAGWRSLRNDWPHIVEHCHILTFLGVVGGGIFGTLQFIGLKYTGALNMGVLNSVAPALIALVSFLIFRDPSTPSQMAGIAISLGGIVAILTQLDSAILQTLSFNAGDLIIVANMGLWAVYSACQRLKPAMADTSFLFVLAVPAALVCAPMALVEYEEGLRLATDFESLGTLLYASLILSILSYICWGRGIELIGVGRAGAFLHLIPLFGALLATSLLGEQLGVHHVVGFALILTGVTLAVRHPIPVRQARARRASSRKTIRLKSSRR